MYARVTIAQFLPDKIDAAIGVFRDSYLPDAKQQKGNRGSFLLIDRKTGKGIAISFWETESDMTAGETSGHHQRQMVKFKDFVGERPITEAYEVSAQA